MDIFAKIQIYEDWYAKAPPKGGADQWIEGHSAMELAKQFFRHSKSPELPSELADAIDAIFPGFKPEFGAAEYVTRLDNFAGGHRNHDMIIVGADAHEKCLVSIEAKVAESLDATVDKKLREAETKHGSKLRTRIENIIEGLGIQTTNDYPDYSQLYYQLLTGAYGTAVEAVKRDIGKALFLIYQIVPKSRHSQIARATQRNKKAVQIFLAMSGAIHAMKPTDALWRLTRLSPCKIFPATEPPLTRHLELYIGIVEVSVD